MTRPARMPGPLDGIRVVDLGQGLAADFCTMLLGDQGAEVIKIEPRGCGDPARAEGQSSVLGESIRFLAANRNKKSVELDLVRSHDLEMLHRLISVSDVFVGTLLPQAAERCGLGWEQLARSNPRLVYCSISGRGEDGPGAVMATNAAIAEALGGLMSVTGARNGPPVNIGVPLMENMTGLFAKDAITAALLIRGGTDRGQKVEISLLESTVAILSMPAYAYLLSGVVADRWGAEHQWHVPWKVFRTRDGHMMVASSSEDQWRKICLAVRRPDLADDERFASMSIRAENRIELYEILDAIFVEHRTETWLAALSGAGAAAAPVNTIKQVFADAQVLARNMVQHVGHATLGEIPQVGHAQKFSQTPIRIRLPPPALGEHTSAVLDDLKHWERSAVSVAERQSAD